MKTRSTATTTSRSSSRPRKQELHTHWGCCMCGNFWMHGPTPCKHSNAKDEIRFFVVCKACRPRYRAVHETDYDDE